MCERSWTLPRGRLDELAGTKQALEARQQNIELPAIDKEMLAALIDNFDQVMAAGPNPHKRDLLHRLVKKVIVHDRRTAEIWYALPNPAGFVDSNNRLPGKDLNLQPCG